MCASLFMSKRLTLRVSGRRARLGCDVRSTRWLDVFFSSVLHAVAKVWRASLIRAVWSGASGGLSCVILCPPVSASSNVALQPPRLRGRLKGLVGRLQCSNLKFNLIPDGDTAVAGLRNLGLELARFDNGAAVDGR